MAGLDVLKPGDRQAIESFRERVRQALGDEVVGMKLFGSKARGTDLPLSDIDVMVIVRERTPVLVDQVLDLAFDTNLDYDVYISPRVVGLPTLTDPLWKATPFLQAIEREGIAI